MRDKTYDIRKSGRGRFSRVFNAIAAVLVAALLIGSAFVLFHARLAPSSPTTSTMSNRAMLAATCSHPLDNGEYAVCLQGEVVPLHGSTTIDGYTFTLISGYADANRALVQFAVHGKVTGYDVVLMESLTTRGNLLLPGGSGTYGSFYNSQQDQTIMWGIFDTQAVPAGTRLLNAMAHLEVMKHLQTPMHTKPSPALGTISFGLPFHAARRVATPT